MGWTFQRFNKNWDSERDIIECDIGVGENGREVVASGRSGSTYFYAVKYHCPDSNHHIPDEDGNITFGLVVLTRHSRGEFGIKFVSEDMGPCETNCPQKVLKALSPLNLNYYKEKFKDNPNISDRDYAAKWREDCWHFHERRKKTQSNV